MRKTIRHFQQMKDRGERIPMVTAYDYTSARLAEAAGIPILLVGDSLGMVMLGHASTIPVTLDDMIHHGKAVVRGSQNALVVVDMPFMTYHVNPEQALTNCGRVMQETGAQAVKIEGGAHMAETVRRLTHNGIPVMGHIGLTPQSVNQFGGYRVQGRTLDTARQLVDDALALEAAGAFAIVLELVPAELAQLTSQRLHVPTIGIGAGVGCDGQVQVWHDMLGLFEDFVPKHARRFGELGKAAREALATYVSEVQAGTFPTEAHSVHMDGDTLAELAAEMDWDDSDPAAGMSSRGDSETVSALYGGGDGGRRPN
jgi:3-methyl-2-oxobutanoate hydroxymethyltransferase